MENFTSCIWKTGCGARHSQVPGRCSEETNDQSLDEVTTDVHMTINTYNYRIKFVPGRTPVLSHEHGQGDLSTSECSCGVDPYTTLPSVIDIGKTRPSSTSSTVHWNRSWLTFRSNGGLWKLYQPNGLLTVVRNWLWSSRGMLQ